MGSNSRRCCPLFSRLKSRRKALVLSILRIQVGHQVGDIAERRQYSKARLLHRRSRRGIRRSYFERRDFSAATRVSRTRTASDTERPMAASALAALALVRFS